MRRETFHGGGSQIQQPWCCILDEGVPSRLSRWADVWTDDHVFGHTPDSRQIQQPWGCVLEEGVPGGPSGWADVWTDDHVFGQTDARLMPDGPADWRFQSDGRACEDRGRQRWVLRIRGLVQIRSAQCASAFTSTSSSSSLFTTTTVHQATLIVLRQM